MFLQKILLCWLGLGDFGLFACIVFLVFLFVFWVGLFLLEYKDRVIWEEETSTEKSSIRLALVKPVGGFLDPSIWETEAGGSQG